MRWFAKGANTSWKPAIDDIDQAHNEISKTLARSIGQALRGAALVAVVAGCGEPGDVAPGATESASQRPNVLVVTVDTLRADHLSGYGYGPTTSPGIDHLLGTAVVFEDAQANSAWTLPSLASIMTSLHPTSHGCIGFRSRLVDSHVTLAEILANAGYRTHGIASHTFLGRAGGLQQGFQTFDDALIDAAGRADRDVSSDRISARAVRWLEARERAGEAEPPWLLWLHYFDPHTKYLDHPGITEQFGSGNPTRAYDGEIAFTDRAISRVLDHVDAASGGRSTLVVFASDHGEAFGEHGMTEHSSSLFGEVTRIPLAIRDERFAPRRVSTPVESLDLLPTLLDLLGIVSETPLAGRSLVPAMRGETLPDNAILAETELSAFYVADSLTLGRWKLIRDHSGALQRSPDGTVRVRARHDARGAPADYLFDRTADPGEHRDVSGARPEVTERLQRELDEQLAIAKRRRHRDPAGDERDLSADERDALRALGYLEEPAAKKNAR